MRLSSDPTGSTHYDYLVVGGGIFGVYAALYLSGRGHRVCLLEMENRLFRKASVVNQARLHTGYHYPRSIGTARMANDYKERFIREHESFVNSKFEMYYAIDRFCSFTDAAQFERFCNVIGIKLQRTYRHPLFDFSRIDAVFKVEEYGFDPYLVANYYAQKLRDSNVRVCLGQKIQTVDIENGEWLIVTVPSDSGERRYVRARAAINATYAGTNTILKLFGVDGLALSHELSELAIVISRGLSNTGLTVMDGPFCSVMPYGLSGMSSLSSVVYTHHAISHSPEPVFTCQDRNPRCTPSGISICNTCPAQPRSNYRKMLSQVRQYLRDGVDLKYMCSLFTIKTKLQSSHIDDSRETVIRRMAENPPLYCLFAGKINSIYEIEGQIPNA